MSSTAWWSGSVEGRRGGEKKGLLFCKKEAKNFYVLGRASQQRAPEKAKVFWFFFSKKNASLTFLTAELLASRLPPLMVAAERVASTVAQGVHGRRRVGTGDSFWQFRPFVEGDTSSRIDWRQSAKSDRAYVRDMEWEAAQTVCLWRDASPSMAWHSAGHLPQKRERAELLLLALASLLTRAGEQVRLMGVPGRVFSGRGGLEKLFHALPASTDGLPAPGSFPRHGAAVLIGDFLSPLASFKESLVQLGETPLSGQVLMVLDPAELSLPYDGRVKFRGLEGEPDAVIPRVGSVRDAYAEAFAAQQAGLAAICAASGFGFAVHRTDHPPESALLALWMALEGGARK